MYCIYLILCTIFVLPVSTNKSITYGNESPDNTARVYQVASNLLPPDDDIPPSQPIVPAEPETPSTSSRIISAIWDLLPRGTSTGLGSSSLMGAVSEPPAMSGFARWLLGDSLKDKCDSQKTKPEKGGSSKQSSDK